MRISILSAVLHFLATCSFVGLCLSGITSACSDQNILSQEAKTTNSERIDGITMVAPPHAFPSDPMPAIKEVNAEWVALVPYAYTRLNEAKVSHNLSWQWWGETEKGIRESIKLAKENGLKIMLKPQVYVPGSWIGELDFKNDQDWKHWEIEYMAYLMTYVNLAIEMNVDMICIGTELRRSVAQRPEFWNTLIVEIKKIYAGKLCYSANWDSYAQIPFWENLDYVGISAYFPLSESATPAKVELLKEWKGINNDLEKFYQKIKKPILFTEYGYLSVDGCAGKTWELEKKIRQLKINKKAQATSIDALLSHFQNQSWWAGGFLWKWFPHGEGHEGYPAKDYTPQNKLAQKVLKSRYE